jgi:hypothetical protein
VLLIACGLFLLLIGMVELVTNNFADNIVVTTFGVYLIATNGFAYLYPDTNAATRSLLAALSSFLLCIVVAFFVFHRYGQEGLFSTFRSTLDVLWVMLLFFACTWFTFNYFVLDHQTQK